MPARDVPEGALYPDFLGHEWEPQSQANAPELELTYNWDPQAYDTGRSFGHLAYKVDNIATLPA